MCPAQGLDAQQLDTVNIENFEDLSEDQIVRHKNNITIIKRRVKRAVVDEWLTSCYDADDAVRMLVDSGVLRRHPGCDPYELMARAADVEFPGRALPEPVTAPIPSVSSSKPFQPVGERV